MSDTYHAYWDTRHDEYEIPGNRPAGLLEWYSRDGETWEDENSIRLPMQGTKVVLHGGPRDEEVVTL
jgi:hypothetical protein